MDCHITKFDGYNTDDPIRVLPVWEPRSQCKNVRSARLVVLIGFPVKQIEEYPLQMHRIYVSPQQN